MSDTGKTSLLVTITGSCLAILSFLLLLALVLTQLALFGLSVNVAAFLLRGLSWAAYALPLYIMVAAGLLLLTNPTPGRIFLYLGSLPPSASDAAFFKGRIASWSSRSIGWTPALAWPCSVSLA